MKFILFGVILVNFYSKSIAFSLLDWFDWTNSGNTVSSVATNQEPINIREGVTLINVPFEELSPEDKFLQEAERLNTVSLSGLDTCEHQVVMKIQSYCADMNEEELAKLSIRLLNCQSEVSGRSQVTCTDQMTLKECTSPMDSETWNAYHIINNRARAVCYAMRQQQFRALSEMTVNKLMSSSLKQLTTMDNLQELQKKLNLLTADTMSSLEKRQQGLMEQSNGLQLAQRKVQDNIIGNLKQLTQEKTAIQSMQNQLKTLSEKLSQEIGDVGLQLENQSEQHQNIHQQILSSLTEITVKTDAIWDAIDKKSQKLLQQQDKIKKGTLETLENLKKINASVNYLLNLVDHVKAEVDQKITWATGMIGGDRAILISVSQHILYLIAGVLVSLFFQLSLVCRLLLLVAVLCNIALVYHHQAIDYLTLSSVIIGMWAVAYLIPVCWTAFKKRKSGQVLRKENHINELEDEEDNISTKSSSKSESVYLNYKSDVNGSSLGNYKDQVQFKDEDSLSSMRYRRSTSITDSKSHLICAALCRNGQLCRSTPTPGHKYCRRHIAR